MRKLRRLAVIGAACAGLTGTVLTGSASAATGGGCGTATNGIQACATWVTGQGFGYYIHNSEPRNTTYEIQVFWCQTESVATSSTKCNSTFQPVAGQVHTVDVVNPGNHPSPIFTWNGSGGVHGIAYSEWYVNVLGGWVPAGASKEVFW